MQVPVTLVDKQHARCGICNAVVSLNRKFEVVHLVRHFNAWHPSVHQCAGKWKLRVGKCIFFINLQILVCVLIFGWHLKFLLITSGLHLIRETFYYVMTWFLLFAFTNLQYDL